MAKKTFEDLVKDKDTYNEDSQKVINDFAFAKVEIAAISSMKHSEGWKVLNKKIREELHLRINEMIKGDPKIQVLISLLALADTKSLNKLLNEEIDKILPESS